MSSKKSVKCKICGRKYVSNQALIDHIEKAHSDSIPEGWNAARYENFLRTGKTEGHCVYCKKETGWNNATGKYNRMCGSETCKKKARELANKNYIGLHGKPYSINDPEQQKKMIYGRKNSGTYVFEDEETGKKYKVMYDSSYGKDFFEMLDLFLNWDGSDIIAPSPHTYYYEYEGKKHFYIPDAYSTSLNLEIEWKDGGDNPNKHPKIQAVDKVKEQKKDEVMKSLKGQVNYIKICNKDYSGFFALLSELREKDECQLPKWESKLESVSEGYGIITESKKTEIYYRITYDGEGIYAALRKNVSNNEWKTFLNSDSAKWLPKPDAYPEDARSLFTKAGFEMFKKHTLPYMEKNLDKGKIEIEELKCDYNNPIYSDEYQIVVNSSVIEESAVTVNDEVDIDTVIFDFGAVLDINMSDEKIYEYYETYMKPDGITENEFLALKKDYYDYTGDVDNESLSYEALLRLYEAHVDEKYRKYVKDMIDIYTDSIHLQDYVVPMLDYLTDMGYKIYYLSNQSRYCWDKHSYIYDPIMHYFIDGIISYKVNLVKPDIRIYKLLIENTGLNPKSSIFFDDRENNVEASIQAGIYAERFTVETVERIMNLPRVNNIETEVTESSNNPYKELIKRYYQLKNPTLNYDDLILHYRNQLFHKNLTELEWDCIYNELINVREYLKKVINKGRGEYDERMVYEAKKALKQVNNFIQYMEEENKRKKPVTESKTNQNCVIISCFAGVGKNYAMEYFKKKGLVVNSLEKERDFYKIHKNPETDVAKHIHELSKKSDILFIPYYLEMEARHLNGQVDYYLVYPKLSEKHAFIKRFKELEFSDDQVRYLSENWEAMISDCDNCNIPEDRKISIDRDTYLTDVIETQILETTVSETITMESGDKSTLDKNFKKKSGGNFEFIDLHDPRAKKYLTTDAFYKENFENIYSIVNGEIAVDRDKDKLAGYIYVGGGDKSKNRNYGFIQTLEVRKEYRGYGLLSRLLDDAIKKYNAVDLTVYKDNEVALNLYKNHGFVIIGYGNSKDNSDYWMKLKTKLSKDDKILNESVTMESTHSDKVPVYIVSWNYDSVIGVGAKVITGSLYNHTSVSLTPDLEECYAFSRLPENLGDNPGGGFCREKLSYMVSKHKNARIKVDAVYVSRKTYDKMKKLIKEYENHQADTKFDYMDFVRIILGIEDNDLNDKNLVCSVFVDHLFKSSGFDLTNGKKSNLVTPADLSVVDKNHSNIVTVYSGKAVDYDKRKIGRISFESTLTGHKDIFEPGDFAEYAKYADLDSAREEIEESTYIEGERDGEKRFPVFAFLTYTDTNIAKVIKGFTHDPYAHSSLSFDTNLDNMLSFDYRGFVKENIHTDIYKKKINDVRYSLYMYMASDKEYRSMHSFIDELNEHRERLRYNLLGLTNFIFGKGSEREDRFFCSEFVSACIQAGNDGIIKTKSYLTTPCMLVKNNNFQFIKRGSLKNYNVKEIDNIVKSKLEEWGYTNVKLN